MENNQFAGLDYSTVARRKFPLSRDIRGTGKFALVSKCYRKWIVRCYQTVELRNLALQKWCDAGTCGSPSCRDEHFTFDLSF